MKENKLASWFERMPVVAILRGVKPEEVIEIGEAVYSAGIGIMEVPLNSPDPLLSIERLSGAMGDRGVVGAGTVLTEEQLVGVAQAGGEIAVSPNTNAALIQRSIKLGLTPMPGWATATDAFLAYQAGARYLKLFPAATYGPGHVKALSAVLPKDTQLLAVGGVGANVANEWLRAGISGFGIGTEIYMPDRSASEVFDRATKVVAAINEARLK